MPHFHKIFIICLLAFPFTAASQAAAKSAQARCICETPALDARWDQAQAIFIGTVEKIDPVKNFADKPGMDPAAIVSLQIQESFKGITSEKDFTLHTSLTRATCMGHPFESGATYLIFAYQKAPDRRETRSLYNFPSGTFDVGGLCGGTQKVDHVIASELLTLRLKRNAAQGGVE